MSQDFDPIPLRDFLLEAGQAAREVNENWDDLMVHGRALADQTRAACREHFTEAQTGAIIHHTMMIQMAHAGVTPGVALLLTHEILK